MKVKEKKKKKYLKLYGINKLIPSKKFVVRCTKHPICDDNTFL